MAAALARSRSMASVVFGKSPDTVSGFFGLDDSDPPCEDMDTSKSSSTCEQGVRRGMQEARVCGVEQQKKHAGHKWRANDEHHRQSSRPELLMNSKARLKSCAACKSRR